MEKKTVPNASGDIIRFSHFSSVRSKCAQTITLQQFVECLRSDHYRKKVEAYRLLLKEIAELAECKSKAERKAKAKQIKESMAAISPASVSPGGHRVCDIRQYSGLVCIDFDHTDERTALIITLLQQLPYVILAFRSISGVGVKAFVRVRPEALEDAYGPLYEAVGTALSRHVAHPYDPQCKSPAQLCYYSWDPELYYNPAATCFPYTPPLHPAPALVLPPTPPAPMGGAAAVAVQQEMPSGQTVKSPATPAGYLVSFVDRFEYYHPFVSGMRNNHTLLLGNKAACNGFSQEELEKLIQLYTERHAEADFNAYDIRKRIVAGYQYIINRPDARVQGGKAHFGLKAHYEPSTLQTEADEEDDVSEINDMLRGSTTCIPDAVYRQLPPLLQQCVQYAENPRERDIVLLSSLVCCSVLFPCVSFFYRDRHYSPHLYLAVVAPAGSGKGAMTCVHTLLNRTHEHYLQQNRAAKKQFEADTLEWEEEQRRAKRDKRKPDINLKPDPPVPLYLKLPGTISKSRFIESLAASPLLGCILLSTEIQTLVSAFAQDYGNFEDILLKSFHHEDVSSSFKSDGEPKAANHPCLAVSLSGTQEQFHSLFRSLESGLYSRFMFYTRPQSLVWENCGPGNGKVNLMEHFMRLGDQLFQMHQQLLQSPTLVTFTPAHWEEHTRTFDSLLRYAIAQGNEATQAIVTRCGLQTMRMAAILTVFRKCSDYPDMKEYTCTDEDFHTALQIAQTVLGHSLLLSTALPATLEKPRVMQHANRLEQALASLSEKFSYTDFIESVKQQGASIATGKRWLQKAVKLKLLVKEEDTYKKC